MTSSRIAFNGESVVRGICYWEMRWEHTKWFFEYGKDGGIKQYPPPPLKWESPEEMMQATWYDFMGKDVKQRSKAYIVSSKDNGQAVQCSDNGCGCSA